MFHKIRFRSNSSVYLKKCLCSFSSSSTFEVKYTPEEVDEIVNQDAYSCSLNSSRISFFHSNQLGVNRPNEDRWNAGTLNTSNYNAKNQEYGHIFSVIDGHMGHSCAHAVNFCHLDYIGASLLNDKKVLNEHLELLKENEFISLVQSYAPNNSWDQINASLRQSHNKNIREFIIELLASQENMKCVKDALSLSLSRLDNDMIQAALPTNENVNKPLLRSVSSGAVGTFAFVPEKDDSIYVAQVGDCGAVLGYRLSLQDNESKSSWYHKLLIEPHNYQNSNEIERIHSSHPINEHPSLILENRLLGELIPLRAFGNVRFKWPEQALKETASILQLAPSFPVTPRAYRTPPYLISQPEVISVPIETDRDSFLILASDGLWDTLDPDEVVKFVGDWIDNQKQNKSDSSENICSLLIKRALGGKTLCPEKISGLLSMPGNERRYYRDDITILVIFLK